MRLSLSSVFRSTFVVRAVIGLYFVLGCSRTEPQAVSVTAAQQAIAADGAVSPAAQAPPQKSAPSSATPVPSGATAAPPDSPVASAISAEVSVDGKPWETPTAIKVRATSLWVGFMVQVESAQGERLTIQVQSGATRGQHFKGDEIGTVFLVRGKETWRKQGDKASADVRSWREDGPHPVLSLDWTAILRKEGASAGKLMRVEARVANVPVAVHGEIPEFGLEKRP